MPRAYSRVMLDELLLVVTPALLVSAAQCIPHQQADLHLPQMSLHIQLTARLPPL